MNEKIINITFSFLLAAFVAFLTFFIVYKAQWLIGDDAIVVAHTGWGHFFNPADTVNPNAGRFYPLAYFVYNILWVLGLNSVNAHFALMAIVFVCFAIVTSVLGKISVEKNTDAVWFWLFVFFFVAICIQRSYNNFLYAYSTIWFDYFLIVLWALCTVFVHTKQSNMAAIIGFFSVSYLCYCLESNFLLPFIYGICGLLFSLKKSSQLEKAYLISMVGTSILFLVLYFFICYVHIDQAYDGSHGSTDSLITNAVKMFFAQKVLWIGFIVLIIRLYQVLVKKEQYEFWDSMLFTSFAFCLGCAILKLNWVLYYSLASLFMLPAIFQYMTRYLNKKVVFVLIVFLALYMCRTLPKYINTNQNCRHDANLMWNTLAIAKQDGIPVYWFEPVDEKDMSYDKELRVWLKSSGQTILGYFVSDENYKWNVLSKYERKQGYYMLPGLNEKIVPNSKKQILEEGTIILGKGNDGLVLVNINVSEEKK